MKLAALAAVVVTGLGVAASPASARRHDRWDHGRGHQVCHWEGHGRHRHRECHWEHR
jgi:hypothetical protein